MNGWRYEAGAEAAADPPTRPDGCGLASVRSTGIGAGGFVFRVICTRVRGGSFDLSPNRALGFQPIFDLSSVRPALLFPNLIGALADLLFHIRHVLLPSYAFEIKSFLLDAR